MVTEVNIPIGFENKVELRKQNKKMQWKISEERYEIR